MIKILYTYLEFYSNCKSPNKTHLFLGHKIISGNEVFTTNFDNLIEKALILLSKNEDKIKPVITEDDFNEICKDDYYLEDNIYFLYKLHGSITNIITQKDVRKSVIATLTSLGINSQNEIDFILPKYKEKIFDSLIATRPLIVMGYSGGDDFDIIPSLINSPELTQLIWIDHSNFGFKEAVLKKYDNNSDNKNVDHLDKLLKKISESHNEAEIYRLKINTDLLIESIYKPKIDMQSINRFKLSPKKWFETNFPQINKIKKIYLSLKLFESSKFYDKEIELSKKLVRSACADTEWEYLYQAYNSLGIAYLNSGIYPKAKIFFKRVIKEERRLIQMQYILAKSLSGLGAIKTKSGRYKKARELMEKALNIMDQNNIIENKSNVLVNLAYVLYIQENKKLAIEKLKEALKLSRERGNIEIRARIFIQYAKILAENGQTPEALDKLDKAMEISRGIRNLRSELWIKNNIGSVYFLSNDLHQAGINHLKAFQIWEQMKNPQEGYELFNNFSNYFEKKNLLIECYFATQLAFEEFKKLGLEKTSEEKRMLVRLEWLKSKILKFGIKFII